MNILFLTNQLNHADGVSTHLFNLISGINENPDVNSFVVCGGGDAVQKFEEAGMTVTISDDLLHSKRSVRAFVSSVIHVNKLIRKEKIKILHSHNHYAANIALRSSGMTGAITVQTVHGIIPGKGRLRHLAAHNYICVNDHVKKFVLGKILNESRVSLIYNGFDFSSTPDFVKIANDKVKVIAASRLEPLKGIETFIMAVHELPLECKDKAEFYITGEGSIVENLKSLNKELDVGVIFSGIKKNLREILERTNIFVIPSLNEGFPMTMLEAAASGNLVITSDFMGAEYILKNNEEGLVFQAGSSEQLSSKLQFAITNRENSFKMAKNFYNTASKKFNVNEMSERHINLYCKMLKNMRAK